MTYNQLGVMEKEYFGLQQNETSVDSPVSIVNISVCACICVYTCTHTYIYVYACTQMHAHTYI